ncbi:MAG TPA: mechanosensitive ion channel domain-containing protein [Bacteroidales bacterium]|nr:mechanosensitive ion channel domain-containing protein [Bacteroidales bacterium]
MKQYFSNGTLDLLIQTAILFAVFAVIYFIYRYAVILAGKQVLKTRGTLDDYIVKLFRGPLLWLIYWFVLNIFVRLFYREVSFYPVLTKITNLWLIFSLALISARFVSLAAYYLQSRYDLANVDKLRARKSLTQVKVFRAIAITIISIIAIGAALMTFEQARKVGISVLTSAGIMGIIVGFAAQKSLGMILAGIQLAITQPIRIDDIVIVEGEFGRIEEIQLTYVVVQIWDERRLILPVTWFLDKPFQNLTRSDSSTTGTIFLYVDYGFPVDRLREILPGILNENRNWDGRTANIQVTNTTDRYKEIRILLSSSDSGKNWDLRTSVRERLIDYINANYPESFAKIRIRQMSDVTS